MPASRPETELLLCCCRTVKSPEMTKWIKTLLRQDIDWSYLLRAAHRHGMAPLLYYHLSDTSSEEAVPKDTLDRLREHFYTNRLRNLLLTGELLKLLSVLRAHGVPAIPYKGPVLATAAYGDLALREFNDLDILVHERDVLKAKELLAPLGYQPQLRMSRAQEAAFIRYERQYVLSDGGDSTVELHWTVVPRYISFPLEPEHLWERAGRISLGGDNVPTFSPEDLLLILCVHGSIHCWERLGWICDVAELLYGSESIDWECLLKRAGVLNSKRMLLLGLSLANELLSADLPESVLREVRTDAVAKELTREVKDQLFSEASDLKGVVGMLEGSAFQYCQFRVIESLRDKLWYLIHRLTAPTDLDWMALPLPGVLFPYYRLIRPVLLTGRFGRRLARLLP